MVLPQWELILRLVAAALFGSIIGFERERAVRVAGLRTHMLVCVGACLFMIVSAYGFTSVLGPHVVLDPSRVAAQVVSGIGFLGAGSIMLRKEAIKGLTTAASVRATAAIGLAAGGGLYNGRRCVHGHHHRDPSRLEANRIPLRRGLACRHRKRVGARPEPYKAADHKDMRSDRSG